MAKTLSELRTLVLEPVDMQEEDFVSDAEVNRYINQGIKQAEAEIHSIYQDYFLDWTTVDLVSGTSEYDLPSDIYATKVRKLLWDSTEKQYEIKRIRDLTDILDIENEDSYYSYLIRNNASSGVKIKFFPTPLVDSTGDITIYYLRDAAQLSADSDELDIPEFDKFVVLYARYECLKKELGNPLLIATKEELESERQLMLSTLGNRIADKDNELLIDNSFYFDFGSN